MGMIEFSLFRSDGEWQGGLRGVQLRGGVSIAGHVEGCFGLILPKAVEKGGKARGVILIQGS